MPHVASLPETWSQYDALGISEIEKCPLRWWGFVQIGGDSSSSPEKQLVCEVRFHSH